jgi:anti-sigma-K factor RskA
MALHEDYKEMLAVRGLGALDPAEARSLDQHLIDCDDCRRELAEWETTAAALALDAAPMAPPPGVRDRILEAVRADTVKPGTAARVSSARTSPRETSRVVSLPTQRKISAGVPAWFAIAAGLVFVVLLGSLFVLWRQNKAARQELAQLTEQVNQAKQMRAQQREAMEIVTAPGARMAELAGTKEMPGAHGMVAFDKNGRAILMAKGLPRPPAGKAYQLWFIAGGKPMPGKVFMTDESGMGSLTDHMPKEAMDSAVFAITLEPSGGVPAPTGAIYLRS